MRYTGDDDETFFAYVPGRRRFTLPTCLLMQSPFNKRASNRPQNKIGPDMTHRLAPTVCALALLITPACAQDPASALDRDAIEDIVREYILENPEIIEEALIALTNRQRDAETAQARDKILANQDNLYLNPGDYSVGPESAPVTIVEFFDYRCGYCKRSASWVMELPESYNNQVRVVFKEFPILSAESSQAALAAQAAGRQGKYLEMHTGLMELDNSSGFTAADIDAVARRAGVDVALMRADMTRADIAKAVADSKALARDIGLTGTPSFVIGENYVAGADINRVQTLIEEALSEAG
jgi:protein-disulfide isomerase